MNFSTTAFPASRTKRLAYKKRIKVAWWDYRQIYSTELHDVTLNIPYRWIVTEGEGDNLNLTLEPR